MLALRSRVSLIPTSSDLEGMGSLEKTEMSRADPWGTTIFGEYINVVLKPEKTFNLLTHISEFLPYTLLNLLALDDGRARVSHLAQTAWIRRRPHCTDRP
jgi:hypothetical protein